jgi:hypothetical protein
MHLTPIMAWGLVSALGGMGIGTYLFLLGKEWARRRWQYEAIRRRMLPPDAARASWAAKRRER